MKKTLCLLLLALLISGCDTSDNITGSNSDPKYSGPIYYGYLYNKIESDTIALCQVQYNHLNDSVYGTFTVSRYASAWTGKVTIPTGKFKGEISLDTMNLVGAGAYFESVPVGSVVSSFGLMWTKGDDKEVRGNFNSDIWYIANR